MIITKLLECHIISRVCLAFCPQWGVPCDHDTFYLTLQEPPSIHTQVLPTQSPSPRTTPLYSSPSHPHPTTV